MDQVKKKWQFPFAVKRRVTVSLKVPVVILLVLFGLIPMILCTHATIASVRQNQIEARMAEVQNQCQILSDKLTRAGYLNGTDRSMMNSEIETVADIFDGDRKSTRLNSSH